MRRELIRIKLWPARPLRARWVAVYRQGGKRQVRYFAAEKAAKIFAAEKQIELLNEGRRLGEITDAERRAVHEAREANIDLGEAVAAFKETRASLARSIPLGTAVEEMLEVRSGEGSSRRHLKDLRLRLGAFAAALARGTPVASVTTRDVDAWLAGLPTAPETRLNYRAAAHNLFAFCLARGWCASNPVSRAAKPKLVPKPPGILTVEQTRALLNACAPEILAPVAIGAFCGLRRAEIERLPWSAVDLERGFIEVSAANSKTAARRLVTVSPNARAWLEFSWTNGGPVYPAGRVYPDRFREARKAAGIDPWIPNALRHGFASHHLARYQDAAKTALQLGHSESRTLFRHYRELVRPEDAAQYWTIIPR
jgi:integrase